MSSATIEQQIAGKAASSLACLLTVLHPLICPTARLLYFWLFFADYRPTYRREAAEDGWKRMLDCVKKNGAA